MFEDLRALLLADPLVADLAGGRVDWGERQDAAALPAVVLQQVGGAEGLTLAGGDGLTQARVQADVYAESFGAAALLARAVAGALHGVTSGRIKGAAHDATRTGREGGAGEALRPFRVSLDFEVYWRTTE